MGCLAMIAHWNPMVHAYCLVDVNELIFTDEFIGYSGWQLFRELYELGGPRMVCPTWKA